MSVKCLLQRGFKGTFSALNCSLYYYIVPFSCHKLPRLLEAEQQEGEGDEEEPGRHWDWGGPHDGIAGRGVDDQGEEGDLNGDPQGDQIVGPERERGDGEESGPAD